MRIPLQALPKIEEQCMSRLSESSSWFPRSWSVQSSNGWGIGNSMSDCRWVILFCWMMIYSGDLLSVPVHRDSRSWSIGNGAACIQVMIVTGPGAKNHQIDTCTLIVGYQEYSRKNLCFSFSWDLTWPMFKSSEIPIGAGLGSSAALSVCLAAGLTSVLRQVSRGGAESFGVVVNHIVIIISKLRQVMRHSYHDLFSPTLIFIGK